jgi:DNA polymerase
MGFFNTSTWTAPVIKGKELPRCGECGLAKTCFSPRMAPTGKGKTKILFVAEAPGEDEDRQGVQLVGKAGKLFRYHLHQIDQELDDAWKTNCVICRPPKNQMTDAYIAACRPNLLKTIQTLHPKVIVLLGASAVHSLISTEWVKDIGALTRWAGWAIPSYTYNAWICPTYHPSYVARMKEDLPLVKLFQEHLKRAYELVNNPLPNLDLEQMKKSIDVITESNRARYCLRELSHKEGILAFDYETTGVKPEGEKHKITTCAFCLNGEETFAVPFNKKTQRLISVILTSPHLKKVGHNIKFEERWTVAKLGHEVKPWHWDTMLASHVLDNRSEITSLKFQSYIQFGIGDYDSHIAPYMRSKESLGINHIQELDIEELLMYNGLDAKLTYMLMERQKEIFNDK